jgi:spermidine synthase
MSLEKIYQLEADESERLYSAQINDETVEVRQWQEYRWLHLSDKSIQSLMQLDAKDDVILPNIQALLSVFLFCPSAKRLLNLGLGGASLERYLDSKWPDIAIRSVESNVQVIQLAKDYFCLPESVDVIADSADHFLTNHNEIYDIILCDIFVADMQASCLYDNEFYANISKCINKEGVLAINILPDSEEDVVNILLPMKNYFDYLYLLEFPDYSNAIIFASKKKIPNRAELYKQAEELLNSTKLDLTNIPERLNVLLETV